MIEKIKGLRSRLLHRIRGEECLEVLIRRGLTVGDNLKIMGGVIIDNSHTWLISIGNNVTLAPRVHILSHDASTKTALGFTKIGCVSIGDNVFIGADSVILPGVAIGCNSIVGANSTVTHDVPDGVVVAGAPARIICTVDEYLLKEKQRMTKSYVYGEEWTLRGGISEEMKRQQKADLSNGEIGYVV